MPKPKLPPPPPNLSKFDRVISIGIDTGIDNTGIAFFDDVLDTYKKKAYTALGLVGDEIDRYSTREGIAIVLAVENPFTNSGHTKGAKGREFRPEKAQGAGYVKALFRVWEQLADSYKSSGNVFFVPVPVQTTHAPGQILRLNSLLKAKGMAIESSHEREAAICALYGYERMTGKIVNA